jgi:hypothetical protein
VKLFTEIELLVPVESSKRPGSQSV